MNVTKLNKEANREKKVTSSSKPVVRGDGVLGILTITDILRVFVDILRLNEGGTLLEAART